MARKENRTYPQYAELVQPFGCAPPNVHCPICGQATMDDDADSTKEFEERLTPCRHLAFLYSGACSEFVYQTDDCRAKLESANLEEVECDDIKGMLTAAGYGNSLLALEIMYGGLACGPVGFFDVWGFDLATLEGEDGPPQG